jgi:signal transduction histidine kinase
MVVARWIAVPWVFLQVLIYSTLPYPPGIRAAALALAAALPVGNIVIWLRLRRVATIEQARILAVAGLAFDVLVASGFVWLYAFDQESALWAILFILPLEGALVFSLGGALASWGAATVLYVAREAWAHHRYGYPLLIDSITFRMGIGLLTALVAGLMARDLLRQRARVGTALEGTALEELRRVDTLRSTLVSTLAHDVRNPLAAVRMAVQTLRDRAEQLKAEDREQLLGIADRQSERLERLAKDLLDLAQIERGSIPLSLEQVPLRLAVERALSFVQDGGRVEVRVDPQLAVRADPGRLEQVIVNLASNATSYGEAPFAVKAAQQERWVTLDFCDEGPGVPADRRDVLFEPFRLGGAQGSVGFGLAIVKGLIEAHGGRISYLPNEPKGSRFRVELPSAPVRGSG